MHLAALRGHVGVVGLLLSRSTTLLKVPDNKGQTCLHVAAKNGHYEMVQVLLGQGSEHTMDDKVFIIKAIFIILLQFRQEPIRSSRINFGLILT